MSSITFPQVEILDVETCSCRFSFVKDKLLKTNLGIALQYISFLIPCFECSGLPGPIKYSISKNIIIYSAAIVEALLGYKLQMMIGEGRFVIGDYFSKPWVTSYKYVKEIYDLPEVSEKIIGAKQILVKREITNKTRFNELIDAGSKCGLLNPESKRLSKKLMKWRNKVHLLNIEEEDVFFSEAQVKESFDIAKLVIDRIESFE